MFNRFNMLKGVNFKMANMDNYQAVGYMLLACKRAETPLKDVKKIYSNMYYMFDMKTEKEAEKQGFEWFNEMREREAYEEENEDEWDLEL